MKIFIPSRDRINSQYTYGNLGPVLQAMTTIVCPVEEVEAHLAVGRKAIARPAVPLAGVRQWLVDEAVAGPEAGYEPIIMLDDDLAFFVRKQPTAHNLRPATWPDTQLIMDRLYSLVAGGPGVLKPVVHAGLSPRQGNNWSFPAVTELNTRMNAVHCILPAALAHYAVRYDDVIMMEDYHVTLSLFEKGENNAAICDAAWDQVKGSGAPGGFAHYRTPAKQAAAANLLGELHPASVKVVTKNQKSGAGAFVGERTDVRVQWKKARRLGISATFNREAR